MKERGGKKEGEKRGFRCIDRSQVQPGNEKQVFGFRFSVEKKLNKVRYDLEQGKICHIYIFFDMVSSMKTTVDIADHLLEEARKLAAKEGKTVKALVEEGLRKVLAERERGQEFQLRQATFKGEGLQPEAAGASWERLREMAYGERGG